MRELTETEIETVSGGQWHHYQASYASFAALAKATRVNPAITDPFMIEYIQIHAARAAGFLVSPMVA